MFQPKNFFFRWVGGNGYHYAETQVEEFFINLNVVQFFLSPKFLMCLAISHLLYSDLLFITSPPPLLAILTASCSCLDRAELWNLTGLMWKFGSPCPFKFCMLSLFLSCCLCSFYVIFAFWCRLCFFYVVFAFFYVVFALFMSSLLFAMSSLFKILVVFV